MYPKQLTCLVSRLCLTLWPHGLQLARLPCPSASPGVCSNSCPLSCYLWEWMIQSPGAHPEVSKLWSLQMINCTHTQMCVYAWIRWNFLKDGLFFFCSLPTLLQYFGHLMWLIGKDPDAGKDWRQEKKGVTEDKMVGWHHRLNGHEFKQTPGDGEGQGSLVCCSPYGHKDSDMT